MHLQICSMMTYFSSVRVEIFLRFSELVNGDGKVEKVYGVCRLYESSVNFTSVAHRVLEFFPSRRSIRIIGTNT